MDLQKVIDDILPALSSIEYDGNIRVEYSNTADREDIRILFTDTKGDRVRHYECTQRKVKE